MENEKKDIMKISSIGAFIASLCCLSPIIFLLIAFGLTFIGINIGFSKADANNLANLLYGDYKWIFRLVGFVIIITGIMLYIYKRYGKKYHTCTIDQRKALRNKIINIIVLSIIMGIILYIVWLYIIVELIGLIIGIW